MTRAFVQSLPAATPYVVLAAGLMDASNLLARMCASMTSHHLKQANEMHYLSPTQFQKHHNHDLYAFYPNFIQSP